MKRRFPKFYRRIFLQKVHHRIIIIFLLALLGLLSAFGIQLLLGERTISKEPITTQLICSRTPTLTPEQLSVQGRVSYEKGDFDAAVDCWQKAADAFHQNGNETETIHNQINKAQAEQALGFLPRACNTLVKIYDQQDCTKLLQDEQKRNQFRERLQQPENSPAKITGLRSLGNILRRLGELNLSDEVLLVSLQKAQPQEQPAIWLDIGNTRRALSNKEQDLYNRSQERENFICGVVYSYAATNAYQNAVSEVGSISDSESAINLQAQLNQLNFLLDLRDWSNKINKPIIGEKGESKGKNNLFNQLFRESNYTKIKVQACWNKLSHAATKNPSTVEVRNWLKQYLSNQNPLIQQQQINNLRQQIEKLQGTHTTLYTKLNFAQTLIRLNKNLQGIEQTIEAFLNTTIKQANEQRDLRAESYALGYLGKLYEETQQWELAKTKTQRALLLAESIPSPEILYQWQWQLGRIYKPKSRNQGQAKAKSVQNNLKDLEDARIAYAGAFETLEALRRELATGSLDAQLSFLEEVEDIYREYVDLLLWEPKAEQVYVSQAREVIASLQAVELENFLRQACPEYNVEQIDKIIDEKSKESTAFIYPIVLDDRIETIVKLPKDKKLRHFSKPINENKDEFDKLVIQLQLDLEEEYTFVDTRTRAKKLYQLLVEEVDKDIEKYNKSSKIKIDTLVFALDTKLRNIPLAALVYDDNSDKPGYLIDKYAIALAPRLDIRSPQLIQGRKLKVLAAGVTKAEITGSQTAELTVSQTQIPQTQFPLLRFVKDELDAIKEVGLSSVSVSQLIDQEFKVEQFKDKINSSVFEVLHLATHGEFSSSPEKTFILAYDKPIKVTELDNVFRTQAQNQPEAIELLVLSACETAAGDQRATLGISGVGVQAGARSAIASLWTLDDEISVEFTRELYKQLTNPKKLTKAQVLQEAQKALKASPGREHPRYWAPYILLGNWL
ncbi:CHAT domain-containing protein [Brasilonema sp. UFV-L1]|uniref:CHAT domain-containing protein n=1 Tax=Brasilonema sp. UFV-L1 TaxID=2234130 RepID=UPI00145E622E|nr:CHAT domain-containing protein [Brasilonema sp. UFV-L1]NMG10212.1 CHAT domain-containing protein [Brasilonema sp. UFV-L1]